MGVFQEIFLSKKNVSKEEWSEFINKVSYYNGIFRHWELIVTNDKNQIRYFVNTKYSLPATLNQLDTFVIKSMEKFTFPKAKSGVFSVPRLGSNLIDLINYVEVKNKGTLNYLKIRFFKLGEDKVLSKIYIYLEKNGVLKKHKILFSLPITLLSIDYEGNKRYFYKSIPKYFDINKILPLLSKEPQSSLLKIDTFPYLDGNYYLNQKSIDFFKHSIIFGASGCGKSKFISSFIENIYRNDVLKNEYKIVVIDPHASLEEDIGGLGKVIDFKHELDSLDLFNNSCDDIISSTELLVDLFKSLFLDQYNPKLERVLRHSIYALLTNESFNFQNLRKLLLDIEYRNDLIKFLKDKLPRIVIEFFLSDFNDLKTKSYSEAISPIIGFIDEMEMIPVFSLEKQNENLKSTIENNFLTLFSLDRIKLGDKVTKTIAGLIMQQLFTLIEKRAFSEKIIFIIDEVAVVENPILSRYLSEARKYNLALILAGQYFNQISGSLKQSIFANVVNYYTFRVSKLDANSLVENFDMKIPLDNSKEQKVKILTDLNNRECIVRVEANGKLMPAFKGHTLDFTSVPRIKRIYTKEEINQESRKEKRKFKIIPTISLKGILQTQSTNRERKKAHE